MKSSLQPNSSSAKFLIYAAAFVVVIAGVKQASALIVPFLLSLFIATIAYPPVAWMQKRKVPFLVAMLVVISMIVAVAFFMGSLIGSSVNDFVDTLPVYEAKIQRQIKGVFDFLQNQGLGTIKTGLAERLDPSIVFTLAGRFANSLSGMLANTLLILITVIFLMLEIEHFPKKLKAIVARPDDSMLHFRNIARSVNRYLLLKTLTSLATGILISVGLTLIGADFPLVWGLLAFFLNFIPNIGSIIAAIPAVLMVWIQLDNIAVLWTVGLYLVVNNLIGSFIEPRFMGKGLGISPLVVFLSLIFWGWVFGPIGMFLSVPLTMVAKISFESSQGMRWLAILLDADASVYLPKDNSNE